MITLPECMGEKGDVSATLLVVNKRRGRGIGKDIPGPKVGLASYLPW